MPFAVTHILVPMILVDLTRDRLFKLKKQILPNTFVLLAGLSGLIPDIDMLFVFFGMSGVHGTITHSLIFPIFFLTIFLITYFLNKQILYRIFLMLFIGFLVHILLDASFSDHVTLFSPFDNTRYGLNLIGSLDKWFDVFASIDAILLFLWLIHQELEHKISEYF